MLGVLSIRFHFMRYFMGFAALPMAAALTACGGASSVIHIPTVSVEPQFQPLVESFKTEAKAQGTPVEISDLIVESTTDLTVQTMGECIQGGGNSPTIQIAQSYWDSLQSDGQQELLFHELGHCVLGRAHTEANEQGIPTSMMNPIFLGTGLFDANRAQYLYELFHQQDLNGALPMQVPANTFLPVFTGAVSSS